MVSRRRSTRRKAGKTGFKQGNLRQIRVFHRTWTWFTCLRQHQCYIVDLCQVQRIYVTAISTWHPPYAPRSLPRCSIRPRLFITYSSFFSSAVRIMLLTRMLDTPYVLETKTDFIETQAI